jgi:peptide/nickel transport system permease protein
MKQLVQTLWQTAWPLRLALAYLALLAVLVLVLPWLPLAYGPNELDLEHIYQSPLGWQQHTSQIPTHWLGTDGLGRDVLANILYGARTALAISLPVMLVASGIGLLLGAGAGLLGNKRGKISRAGVLTMVLALFTLLYYAVYLPAMFYQVDAPALQYGISLATGMGLALLLLFGLTPLFKRIPFLRTPVSLPADGLLLRLIEVQTSIPRLILILVLAAIAPPTLTALAILLVLTFWTGTARLARAEMLRIRELPFFEAGLGMGIPLRRLLLRHALPHLLGPVLVAFSFGLAGLLMLESTLSFLGIGVSTELASWGRLISGIRSNTSAWWLVAIPGAILSVTVLALQTCSYFLLKYLQKRAR